MWTKTKSLLLSRILTMVTGGIVLILTFFVPAFSKWYEKMSLGRGLFEESGIVLPMCICLYICEVCALAALYELHILLENINKEQVFTERNTSCLRRISWACMLAGISFAIFGLWKFVFLLPAMLAVMFGLIMRVLKNVFEKAVEIKSENDFTV